MKFVILAVACMILIASESLCVTVDNDAVVNSQTAATLIVTHASRHFDHDLSSKDGLVRTVSTAKSIGLDIYYLVDEPVEEARFNPDRFEQYFERGYRPKFEVEAGALTSYFLPPIEPTLYVRSGTGEHSIIVTNGNLILAGGFFEACASKTVADAIAHAQLPVFTVTLPMIAIFSKCTLFSLPENSVGDRMTLQTCQQRLGRSGFTRFAKSFAEGLIVSLPPRLQRDFVFIIFNNGKEVGTVGHGTKKVKLKFINAF